MYKAVEVCWRCLRVICRRSHTESTPKYYYLSHFCAYILTVLLSRLLRAPKHLGNSQITRTKWVHRGIKLIKNGALLTDNTSLSQPVLMFWLLIQPWWDCCGHFVVWQITCSDSHRKLAILWLSVERRNTDDPIDTGHMIWNLHWWSYCYISMRIYTGAYVTF